MKVLIAGDVHFGAGYSFGRLDAETGINSRLLDYEKTLGKIVTYAIDKKIELFIFLGDIFETRNPSSHQISCFYRQIKRLSDAKITVYIIAGNHDVILSRKIYSSLDPLKEINIPHVSVFTDIDLITFVDKHQKALNILLMPYRNRQSYNKVSNEEAVAEMSKEIEIAKTKAIRGVPILLVGHMMMESTIPSDVGEYGLNELVLPFSMFDGIVAVINGHIHRAQILKEDPVFIYSGSIECKDFNEKDHQKCFLIYDSEAKGIDAIKFKGIQTRKFFDFDIDFSSKLPENPLEEIFTVLSKDKLFDSVVRVNIKLPETKISTVNISIIREKLHELGVNCISEIKLTPVIIKQNRNQKVNEAQDDISAFKHYIAVQTNVDDTVLEMGIDIIDDAQLE